MKKFKSLFLVAAALMLGFTSCQTEGGEDVITPSYVTVEGSSMRFSLALPTTLQVGPSQQQVPVHIGSGTIIFSNNATILAAEPANMAAVFQAQGGQTVTNLPGGITHVHFVGNTNLAPLGNLVGQALSNVTDHLLTVNSQMQTVDNAPPTGQVGNNVVNVFGQNTITMVTPATGTVNAQFETLIALEPTVARLEIFNVTGNEHIAGFTLNGIFVDNFYMQGRVAGGGAAWRTLGEGPAATNFVTGSPAYAGLTHVVYDIVGTAATSQPSRVEPAPAPLVNRMRVALTGDNVWGYNLFANNSRTPRVAIRLQGVTIYSTVTTEYVVNATTTLTSTPIRVVVPHPLNETVDPAWNELTPAQIDARFVYYAAAPHNLTGQALVNAVNAWRADHLADRATVNTDPMFVSINGFRNIPRDTGFQARRVYQLGSYTGDAGDQGSFWTFGPEDIDEVPFRREIDVNVQVTIQNWMHVHVFPEL